MVPRLSDTRAVPALREAQAPVSPIGRVTTADGPAIAERADGSTVALETGSAVFQGDTVVTGSSGSLAITFVDGTLFALGADARMTIDELVYDPGGAASAAAFALLEGTFVFVTGAVAAAAPDAMAVTTPVATIGIRGTAVAVRLGEGEGAAISLLPDPEGHLGRAVVANAGVSVVLDEEGETTLVASADAVPLRPEIFDASRLAALYGPVLSLVGLGSEDAAEAVNLAADAAPATAAAEVLDRGADAAFVPIKVLDEAAADGSIAFTFLAPPQPVTFAFFGVGFGFFGVLSLPDLPPLAIVVIDGHLLFIPVDRIAFLFGTSGDDTLVGGPLIDEIFGLGGDDTLLGASNDDELFGGAGNDVLDGGEGRDLMLGGPGDDTYFVDNAEDFVSEEPGEGRDTATATSDIVTLTEVEEVFLVGDRDSSAIHLGGNAVTIVGNGGNNILVGGEADDALLGGAGDDSLVGLGGADAMSGGAGLDSFFYLSPGELAAIAGNGPAGAVARDTIADFAAGLDQFVFDIEAVPGIAPGRMVEGLTFSTIGAAFDGTNAGANLAHDLGLPSFVFSTADATLYVDADGDAPGYSIVATLAAGAMIAEDVVVADLG